MLSRNLKILIAIVLVVVLPSAAALSWYWVTKDPTVRPLGITKQALDARGAEVGSALTIVIRFDPEEDKIASKDLGERIVNALEAKGVTGEFKLYPALGQKMNVTYLIGASSIGPYPASSASSGVNAAAAAYHMIVPTNASNN